MLVAVCVVASAFAVVAMTMNDPDGLGSQNPGLDVTRHAMPPPDITAPPANDAPNVAPQSAGETTPAVSATPAYGIVPTFLSWLASTSCIARRREIRHRETLNYRDTTCADCAVSAIREVSANFPQRRKAVGNFKGFAAQRTARQQGILD